MNFCCECANMLYPKENKEEKKLMFACRNCDHEQAADDNCVYRNELLRTANNLAVPIMHDVTADPTLPRTVSNKCAKCGGRESVYFQAHTGRDEAMALYYVCCNSNCDHRWRE
eukprot:TRINITY_DN11382_c0_g1_i1.p1 TRINITY_DN11382_c0_g1~~TRINITY_DN11382_c0_g1_i1.p1  ORF type:complete len:113 (+),score=6.87 TRINITY_DN11382_c0_g1_i1:126-464(+)